MPVCRIKLGTQIAEGGEHRVYQVEGRIYKETLPGFYGRTLDETRLLDPRTFQARSRLTLRDALPSEYLARWEILNSTFGLTTEFEGVAPSGSLIVSQPFLSGGDPAQRDVDALLKAAGFSRVAAASIAIHEISRVTWYRQRDGVLVSDAFARNFKLTARGTIVPIDLMVQLIPPGISRLLPDSATPFQLPPARKLR